MENRQILALSRYGMIVAGIWRLPFTSRAAVRKFYALYSAFVHVFFAAFVASMLIRFLILVAEKSSAELLFGSFAYLISFYITAIKAVLCQSSEFKRILSYIVEEERRMAMSNNQELFRCHLVQIRFAERINLGIFSITVGLSVSAVMANAMQRANVEEYNRSYNASLEKHFVYELYYAKVNTEDHERLLAILHAFTTAWILFVGSSTQCIFITCIVFASSVFKTLQIKLRMLSTEDALKNLRSLVVEHQNAILFGVKLNSSVKYLMLMDFLFSSLNIGLVLILLLRAENTTQFTTSFYACRLITIIFAIGWCSNEVQIQSLGLSDAIYESPWYEQTEDVKKILLMMIVRVRKPVALTIGPFDEMTLQSSLRIMKAAYSYCGIMAKKYN
ncbi:uncharacterized protein LOC132706406 [Cylas formicarius]|uniref:uncharacterized protein LOC132706406 n=1 Tax=Cylas formicarius TaxID=197179 RepID=UPI002958C248|nr:uncharacterized protein LOC132706406 [Cylas formicarius]